MTKPTTKLTIEQMATKHVLGHPNDKSDYIRSKMNGRFGIQATGEAIMHAYNVLKMMDPHHPNLTKENLWFPPPFGTVTGRIRGRHARFIVLDEASGL